MTYAEKLIEIRLKEGLPQAGLSKKCDLSSGMWSKWERGINKPSKPMLKQVISKLQLPQDTFINCVYNAPIKKPNVSTRHVMHHTPISKENEIKELVVKYTEILEELHEKVELYDTMLKDLKKLLG
jgi:transcriptional regulator with XRE-family HTH domain